MSNFISLDEAAKKLGVSHDELVEMRSRGDIFGYRDGGSWKFKPEEIERVANEMMGVMDEDPAGSSILVSESELGLAAETSDVESDVSLVADPGTGSDVRLVASQPPAKPSLPLADDDDDELSLSAEDGDDLMPGVSGSASSVGSDVELAGSDLGIGGDSAIGSDVPLSGSDPALGSGVLDFQGSDLELSDDDGDLVLGGGSDLALGNDSGINLMSPSDSGISLEDEPLDLAASGISGLDLATEGSDVENGSAVDFQQDEEFQLSPSGSLDADDDSGSQVIELEDSSEFGDAAVALPSQDGFDAFADVEGGGFDEGSAFGETAPAAAASIGIPEVPYSLPQVLGLLGILLLMCMSGILVTDVVRNMWAWSGAESSLTSGFTSMVLSAFGMK